MLDDDNIDLRSKQLVSYVNDHCLGGGDVHRINSKGTYQNCFYSELSELMKLFFTPDWELTQLGEHVYKHMPRIA
jgi:hypothetical protein